MKEKELVMRFFTEGYCSRNFDAVMDILAEDYIDHSPAAARNSADAVSILKAVAEMFEVHDLEFLDVFCEKDLVATRIRYDVTQTGVCMGIPPTGKRIAFEALENFRVENGRITESWGYWPDKGIEKLLRGEA